MKKTCLNCKYEPDWGKWTKGEYSRTYGECQWDKPIPELPAVYEPIWKRKIERHADDSGIYRNCPVWEKGE